MIIKNYKTKIFPVIYKIFFIFITFLGSTNNFTNGKLFADSNLKASSIVLAAYGGVWAYSGYDVLNYGAEDIKNFKRFN